MVYAQSLRDLTKANVWNKEIGRKDSVVKFRINDSLLFPISILEDLELHEKV